MELLLRKYLADACTPEEANRLFAWLDTPEGQQTLQRYVERDFAGGLESQPAGVHSATDPLWRRIRAETVDPDRIPLPVRPRWVLRAAVWAGLFLLAGAGYWLKHTWYDTVRVHSPYGMRKTIALPDGSTVTLNGNSSVSYPRNFMREKTRQVKLEGQAFFSVSHQPGHRKFMVYLPDESVIEVVGTEFEVLSRKAYTRVVLNNGKIRFRPAATDSVLMLRPGDMVETQKGNRQVRLKQHVDTDSFDSWRYNVLTFEEATFTEVAALLETTYGYTVIVSDPEVRTRKFSGKIPDSDPAVMLEALAKVLGLEITPRGSDTLIISSSE